MVSWTHGLLDSAGPENHPALHDSAGRYTVAPGMTTAWFNPANPTIGTLIARGLFSLKSKQLSCFERGSNGVDLM